jgi:hypothetical protein
MLSQPERFVNLGLKIRVFADQFSQFAIRQPGVYLPPLIAELLKQSLPLPSTLQPIVEIGDRRRQFGRSQQGSSSMERNQLLCLLQRALQPATSFLEKSAQFPEIQLCAQLCDQGKCLLAIVREIARAHGGDVRVSERSDGPGASFELSIPIEPGERGAREGRGATEPTPEDAARRGVSEEERA